MGSYDSVLAVINAAPELDPSSAYGFANIGGDGTEPAIATAAFGMVKQRVKYLNQQPAKVRKQIFDSYDAQSQQMLVQAGYTPLIAAQVGGVQKVAHGIGHAIGAALHFEGESLGEGLSALGAPLRAVQHTFRAASYIGDMTGGGKSGFLHGSLGATFSPGWWSRAWRETEHGEQYFSPIAERDIKRKYASDVTGIARQLASGASPESLAATLPPSDRPDFLHRVATDPTIHDATAAYSDAHVTFGQRVLGPHWLGAGPEVALGIGPLHLKKQSLGHLVSGTLDAAGDWYADPTIMGIDAAKGVNEARYLVGGPGTVSKLVDTNPGVQRWIQDVGTHLADRNVSTLIDRYPRLAEVAPQWIKAGVDSPEKLGEWFKTTDGLSSLMAGKVTGPTLAERSVQEMPHLSRLGVARLAMKGGAKRTIDFLADRASVDVGPLTAEDLLNTPTQHGLVDHAINKVAVPAGKTLRAMTTLTPKADAFDATSDQALTIVKRIAGMSLPARAVNRFVDEFAYAPNLEGRRQVYKSMLNEMFHASGVMDTGEGRSWASGFIDSFEDGASKVAYSTGDRDAQIVNGVTKRTGILEADLTETWAIPNFKELWANSQRASLTKALFGKLNNDAIDRFMTTAWKPLALLRAAFPLRVGIDELGSQIAREGPLGALRSRLATSAITDGGPANTLTTAWERLTRHLPQAERDAIGGDGAELVARSWGNRVDHAFRAVQGKLAGDRYVDAARDVFKNYPQAFGEEISAVDGHGLGFLDDRATHEGAMRVGAQSRRAQLIGTGGFREYQFTEPLAMHAYYNNLDKIAKSRLARPALEHFEEGVDAQHQAVLDVLSEEGNRKLVARAHRGTWTIDGRQVGVDATREEALQDWASVITDHVNGLVTNADGKPIPTLTDRLLADKAAPDIAHLRELPESRLPEAAYGPEMIPFYDSWLRGMTNSAFDRVVGRPLNWLVRQPMFVHQYALAKEETARVLAPTLEGWSEKAAANHVAEVAMDRAVENTIPFIHDPEVRSQFAVVTRNLAPFYFAQEQFFKRWARTFAHSPEALRQAQLVFQGAKHSGIVQTDDQGNASFFYPGGDTVQRVLVAAYNALPGHPDISVPVPVSFTGDVKMLVPGLDRIGIPSAGPLISVPLSQATKMFPELEPVQAYVEGEAGQATPLWEQLVPGTLSRIVNTLTADPDKNAQMISAHNQAIQYLDATGHGLAADATAQDKHDYEQRVKHWTRILMINRTIFGFTAPASPRVNLDPKNLNAEFRNLLSTADTFDEAQQEFIRLHPDATAYTVFQSETASKLPLPATKAALTFMEHNADFLREHSLAASAFFPGAPGDYDPRAYREQMQLELRRRKDPKQFLDDVIFADAAAPYFDAKAQVDEMLASVKGTHQATVVEAAWAAIAKQYKAEHPLFRDQLESATAAIDRRAAREELVRALDDPRAPKNAQTGQLRDLMDAYKAVVDMLNGLAGRNDTSSENKRKAIKAAFNTVGAGYVKQYPALETTWNRLFAPEFSQ